MLTPWPAQPGEMERSNRETIARLGDVEVETLPAARACARSARSRTCRSTRWLDGPRQTFTSPRPDQYGCSPPFGLMTWPVV